MAGAETIHQRTEAIREGRSDVDELFTRNTLILVALGPIRTGHADARSTSHSNLGIKRTHMTNLVESFRKDGFVVIPQLVNRSAIRQIGTVYDAMINSEIGADPADKSPGRRIIREVMMPSAHNPVFRDNAALDAGREVARELLSVDKPVLVFDLLIYKEPGQLAETPWHQDFAYAMPDAQAGSPIPVDDYLQFWLALDDVDEANGCMHFAPGVHHQPYLEHRIADWNTDNPQRLLAIRDPERLLDLDRAVACPLKAGGATIHNHGTPHFTPGNRTSDRRRRAYVFKFAKRPFGE